MSGPWRSGRPARRAPGGRRGRGGSFSATGRNRSVAPGSFWKGARGYHAPLNTCPRDFLVNAPACLAALVLALASLPALAKPAVLLSPALGRPGGVTLQGRVLAETPHGSTALSRNLRSLAARNWK